MFGRKPRNTTEHAHNTLAEAIAAASREPIRERPTITVHTEKITEILTMLEIEHDDMRAELKRATEEFEAHRSELETRIAANELTAKAYRASLDVLQPPTPMTFIDVVKVHDPDIQRQAGCIACANGNDLSDGDECASCGRIGNVPPGA